LIATAQGAGIALDINQLDINGVPAYSSASLQTGTFHQHPVRHPIQQVFDAITAH